MRSVVKVLLGEVWFLLVLPLLGAGLVHFLGVFGLFLYLMLFVIWCWELFAYSHYRVCRQQEVLHVLETAAATQVPLEAVLSAYLEDRPRDGLHRFLVGILLFFVFPGYYWIHLQRRFDARLNLLVAMLESGVPLHQALGAVPGVVSREVALAITVGAFTGRLALALHRFPGRRAAPLWLELAPRLMYPLLVLFVLLGNLFFLCVVVIPKFEKIFSDFKIDLPAPTRTLIDSSRWVIGHVPWGSSLLGTLLALWIFLMSLVVIPATMLLFSSRAKWYFPILGGLYRLRARGEFLHLLGLMLETGKPLPEILEHLSESRLLPRVVAGRVAGLAEDVQQGQSLVESLARHGLATKSVCGLILAAEKTQNLPRVLQELGETLMQRCARRAYRLAMVGFPVFIFACACLIGFVAVAMFSPLVALIRGVHG
ncbi:MAG TPA: type II secretion system F family protein [Gemmataceae bacterium]|nr:type II secretion system F family protein [Gemmataceae bacterium]